MSLLVKKGLSPDVVDKKGKTALHYAAFAGQLEILQTLIAHNADTEKRDHACRAPPVPPTHPAQDGNTPLLCAAQANQARPAAPAPARHTLQFLTANNLVNNSSNVNAQNRQLKCGDD